MARWFFMSVHCIRYPARSNFHETTGGNYSCFWSNRGSGSSLGVVVGGHCLCHIGERGRSVSWVRTPFAILVLFSCDFHWRPFGPFVRGKAFARQGLGWSLTGCQLRPIRIGSGAPLPWSAGDPVCATFGILVFGAALVCRHGGRWIIDNTWSRFPFHGSKSDCCPCSNIRSVQRWFAGVHTEGKSVAGSMAYR